MKSITSQAFRLHSQSGFHISGTIRSAVEATPQPVVIVLHGFKAFKDWGFFPYLCERLAHAGAIAVNFNYSLNGFDEGSDGSHTDMQRFARNTVSQELADIRLVLNALQEGSLLADTLSWNGHLYVLGHSRGAGLALITAREQPTIERVMLWAPVSSFQRYTERQKKLWQEQGYVEVLNTRTNELLRQNVDFLNDIEENTKRFSLTEAIQELRIPIGIVIGAQDMTTPPREAQKLVAAGGKTARISFCTLPATGHTFGAVHPFGGTSPALEEAIHQSLHLFSLADEGNAKK